MSVNANEGKRAISSITKEVCANCGASVKCADGLPVVKCCDNFVKK
jgi:hypothetical protein